MKSNELTQIEKLESLYYRPLFRLARRLSGSPIAAMALTQRTFRLAFDYIRVFPVPANKRAWLAAILFSNFLKTCPHGHAA